MQQVVYRYISSELVYYRKNMAILACLLLTTYLPVLELYYHVKTNFDVCCAEGTANIKIGF
jgi:hypothetical protein